MKLIAALAVVCLATSVVADVYMQFPPGSNDRLNEQDANRNNANRLFNSQNNAKGGYCHSLNTPPLSFYEGSILPIQWTAQHGCGNPKLECNMVIQYQCGRKQESDKTVQMRDGSTTATIPNDITQINAVQADGTTAAGQYTYGMHESFAYYQACRGRQRNMGLFVADRVVGQNDLNGFTADKTRQSPNGNRYGFECPEERDYYPYWHPSPWKDIAVLANDAKQCKYYQAESQNVKEKGYCYDPATSLPAVDNNKGGPNNANACTAAGLQWKTIPSFGISAPDCLQAPWSRDNHLGNDADSYGETANYNWTLPTGSEEPCINDDSCTCVLRLRYNISTADVNGWGFDDILTSGKNSPVLQDPYKTVSGNPFRLALDTTQFGRTFQDRSHMFEIKSRPSNVKSYERIFNLSVRGKRGNIVQTFPATEYDFVPTQLVARQGDYIHFQWTGCDDNPDNDGEGRARTDRHNIVQIAAPGLNQPVDDSWYTSKNALFDNFALRQRMSNIDQTNCLTVAQMKAATNQNAMEQNISNCAKLNAGARYFDGGLVKMNNTGQFYYMSSRNNNFSNRGQKATITIIPILPAWAIGIVSAGAALFVASGGVAGAMFYANAHPHTAAGASINNVLAKLRM